MTFDPAFASIFPRNTTVAGGRLSLAGCDAQQLTLEFGSPLYVFDEMEIRETCREYVRAFTSRHADTEVTYASKAYLGRFMASVARDEGIGLDIVSGGELAVARSAGFPPSRCHFHGNNKCEQELREAITDCRGDRPRHRRQLLRTRDARRPRSQCRQGAAHHPASLARRRSAHARQDDDGHARQQVRPPIVTGQAEQAVAEASDIAGVDLVGLHCHLGSPMFAVEPYAEANDVMFDFAAKMEQARTQPARVSAPAAALRRSTSATSRPRTSTTTPKRSSRRSRAAARENNLPLPHLFVEPGRSLVARAGVALYTVGSNKHIEGLRPWVSVDGGMADNIRPAIYDSKYRPSSSTVPTTPRPRR